MFSHGIRLPLPGEGNMTTSLTIACRSSKVSFSRSVNFRRRPCDGIPPRVVQFGERGGEFATGGFHRQLVAADFAALLGHVISSAAVRG